MTEGPGKGQEAAEAWLVSGDFPEAVVVAHATETSADDEAARRWIGRILAGERDGSWGGDLLATARSLLILKELRDAASLREQDPAVGRALDWMKEQRRLPGRWTDGCSPSRHRRGVCHHFAAGFYSPAPPEEELDVTLPCGAPLGGDGDARFAVSALALRCRLAWRDAGTDDRLHLAVLREVVGPSAPELGRNALLAGAHALLASPSDRDREVAGEALAAVATSQRGDGSWPEADVFHAMEVYLVAAAAGVGGKRVRAAVEHGARLLRATQRPDGSWGPDHGPRRVLIGWRALGAVD